MVYLFRFALVRLDITNNYDIFLLIDFFIYTFMGSYTVRFSWLITGLSPYREELNNISYAKK